MPLSVLPDNSFTPPSVERAEQARDRYRQEVQAEVEAIPGNVGKMLAFDPDTGDYEVADSILDAVDRLRARRPQARPFAVRIGYPTTVRIGAGRRK